MARGNTQHIEDAEWGSRLVLILEEFRKISPDITANQMLVILTVGLNPDINQAELAKKTKLDDGTIARLCGLLSEKGSRGREGLRQIEVKLDPKDYRFRIQSLSKDGHRTFDTLRHLMKGGK